VYLPPGAYNILGEVSIPPHVTLWMARGARLTTTGLLSPGAITINGPVILEGGPHFDFGTQYDVVKFGQDAPVVEVFPEWWGAVPFSAGDSVRAFRSAFASGAKQVKAVGHYGVSGEIVFGDHGQSLEGVSVTRSVIEPLPGFVGAQVIRIINGPFNRLNRMKIVGSRTVDCVRVDDSSFCVLEDLYLRGGRRGVNLTRGNIQRWRNLYAETCVDGFVVDPTSDDTNGGTFIGIRAYQCTGWGLDVRKAPGAGIVGSSCNTWDFSAESCANGVRVDGGQYCQYTLYAEGISGTMWDLSGSPHWYNIRNPDSIKPTFAGRSIGVNGDSANVYLDGGQAPERVASENVGVTGALGGVGVKIWVVTNTSRATAGMRLAFLGTAPVGFRCKLTKRDNTPGCNPTAPPGMTLVGDTGTWGAFPVSVAVLEVMKISSTIAVLKAW
jgi:hypothetical protein